VKAAPPKPPAPKPPAVNPAAKKGPAKKGPAKKGPATTGPGPKPKPPPIPAAPKQGKISALAKKQDQKDAEAVARVAHTVAKAVVTAAFKRSKIMLAKWKKKGKGTKKLSPCQQQKLQEAALSASTAMKHQLEEKGKCGGKGKAPMAAIAAARSVFSGKLVGNIAGGHVNGMMGHMLAEERQLSNAVAQLKAWSVAEKKFRAHLKKKTGKKSRVAQVTSKAAVNVGTKAAAAAAVKGTFAGLCKGKVIKIATAEAAKAIAKHLLAEAGKKVKKNKKGKGKGGKCKDS
jgi:D-Tyr-tRNAtyr deacylase